MHTDELYLNCAGVIIRIIFQPVLIKPWISLHIIHSIKESYKKYTISPSNQIDHTIEFIFLEKNPEVIFDRKLKKSYIELTLQKGKKNKTTTFYHISLFAFNLLVLRIIDEFFANTATGFILHSSAIVYKSNAYLFLAPSGGGKSTLSQMIGKENIELLADDTVAIRKIEECYKSFAIPEGFDLLTTNTAKMVVKKGHTLQNIFFLIKDNIWSIESIKTAEQVEEKILKQLLTQSIYYKKSLPILYDFLAKNLANVYFLHFPKKPQSCDFLSIISTYYDKNK